MTDLLRAFYWFDEGLQTRMSERGWERLPRGQSLALLNIAMGINRPADLARSLGITRQAVAQIIQELRAKELVTLAPDPHDRRAQIVDFSEQFVKHRDDATAILAELEQVMASRIGLRRFKSLRAALGSDWTKPEIAVPGKK